MTPALTLGLIIFFILGWIFGYIARGAVSRRAVPAMARATPAPARAASMPKPIAPAPAMRSPAKKPAAAKPAAAKPAASKPAASKPAAKKPAAKKPAAKKPAAKKPAAKKPAAKKPAAKKPAAKKPAVKKAAGGAKDDLKLISGVGPVIEKKLQKMGVSRYADIAKWAKADIDKADAALNFKGRIRREKWVAQAKTLAGGGQTAFSKRKKK